MILEGEGLDQNASCIFLANEDEVIDIFSIESDVSRASVPKFVTIELQGNDNGRLRVDAALVDGGAMVSAMDKGLFEKVKNQITGWEPSVRRLRMANGVIVPATAQWRGKVLLQGEEVEGVLQVFDSGGGWDVLLGKPLLKAFGAVHDFADDSVVVRKRVSEVFQKGLGKQVSICEVEDDDEKLADIRVQIPPEEKARTSDGGSERSQTPRFRDVENPFSSWDKLTPLPISFSDLPFNGDDPSFKTQKEKHERLWEEERERHEEDRVLRRIAENIVQRRKDEYKTKRKEEDIRVAERLERQKEKAEEETKQNVDKERRTAREFWKTHGAKWRFHFTCRKGAFTPVRGQKGIPMHMSAEKRRRRSVGKKRYQKCRRRKSAMRSNSVGGSNAPPSRGVSNAKQVPISNIVNPDIIVDPGEVSIMDEDATRSSSVGGSNAPPSRGVFTTVHMPTPNIVNPSVLVDSNNIIPICIIDKDAIPSGLGSDIFPDALDSARGSGIFTRNNGKGGAFKPERVEEILRQVKLGSQLTPEQHTRAADLIREYADCFALTVGEVCHVPGAVHKLDVPDDATFSRKIHQRPLTPPQKAYMHGKIDELLAAGVIEQCDPSEVKCVSPTTLAKKAHEGGGLAVEELQHRLNDQCVEAGLPPCFELPPRPVPRSVSADKIPKAQKWRICQNFNEVNKVTKIAPMPQGIFVLSSVYFQC
ncbi:hypothetical protein BDP27DRAFT_1413839 [Rhodocollybia butyracea]|uniref:Peptidase A2 domain-containing protein n=1 Tax=Rhodocollybia butyracea TaxID=206335 RepID=A0A9P5Q9D5_9AGAR|nr:hypothetical protein BDP27DRAFT_1413839 [Rhodocollybia butyracea]